MSKQTIAHTLMFGVCALAFTAPAFAQAAGNTTGDAEIIALQNGNAPQLSIENGVLLALFAVFDTVALARERRDGPPAGSTPLPLPTTPITGKLKRRRQAAANCACSATPAAAQASSKWPSIDAGPKLG